MLPLYPLLPAKQEEQGAAGTMKCVSDDESETSTLSPTPLFLKFSGGVLVLMVESSLF
jgi:hypothetical protein